MNAFSDPYVVTNDSLDRIEDILTNSIHEEKPAAFAHEVQKEAKNILQKIKENKNILVVAIDDNRVIIAFAFANFETHTIEKSYVRDDYRPGGVEETLKTQLQKKVFPRSEQHV